jgi:hypothetical protein
MAIPLSSGLDGETQWSGSNVVHIPVLLDGNYVSNLWNLAYWEAGQSGHLKSQPIHTPDRSRCCALFL